MNFNKLYCINEVFDLKLNKLAILFFILSAFLLISSVGAGDLNDDASSLDDNGTDLVLSADNPKVIYVDDVNGDDLNDGKSQESSLKTFEKALNLANDDDSIQLASGNYTGLKNTRITISKSVNVIGSDDTTFDGCDLNYIFKISDSSKVTFKNIRFINAYKITSHSTNFESMYGGALEIGKSSVFIEKCSFIKNMVDYDDSVNKFNYGGAISNLGDLTIVDSYFDSNIVASTSGLFSYGGAIYNAGNLIVNSTTFNNSRAGDFGYGGAIYNDGNLVIDNSIFRNAISTQETKASVLFNAGNCTLKNSLIENNSIARADFLYIYGAIYNYGSLVAYGNIFRNNSGLYEVPNPEYHGSPTIFNVGDLNLTYCAFMDNTPFNGIASDVYHNGGNIISLDNNWWSTNEDPFEKNKINVADSINSWFVFNLSPEYTALNIGDSVDIVASWSLSSKLDPKLDLFPVLNVTFKTDSLNMTNPMLNGKTTFHFDYTQIKGLYEVIASMGEYDYTILVDVGKKTSHITVNVSNNVTYTDDILMDVEVTSDDGNVPTGNVSVIVGKTVYVINLTDGKGFLNISRLDPDKYSFKIIYEGSDDYFKAFEYANVSVNKAHTDLKVFFPDIMVDQKGSVTVTLGPAGVQGQANLYINGVRKKILYLYNGNTTVGLSNFAEGEYNVTVEFWGTKYYEASTANATFKVSKYDTSLKINVTDIKIGENQTIKIIVEPSDLVGEATLSINGVNSTIFLDSPLTEVNVGNLAPGAYDVELTYPENSKYHGSSASASFNVYRTFTSLDVDIAEDGFDGVITIRTNYTDCTGEVGVYINYRLYMINLTKGMAKFKVTFDKGTNYIYAFYDGDDNYEGCSWNTTIGVAEEFILIGQNATGFEHNDFSYVIRLIEYNGIPMPNRIVSVLFDGRSYNVTTNNEGIAYFPVNLNAGSYEISASYKNQTVVNSLTVKEINFNIKTDDAVYGSDAVIVVEFENGLSGNASIFIENILNETIGIADGKATYNVSGLRVGKYDVIVRYVNDYFVSDDKNSYLNVIKADPTLDAEINDIVYGTDGIIKITLPADATGEVTFDIDGETSSKTLENGSAQVIVSNMDRGIHNVSIRYEGDSNYNNASINSIFSVKDAHSDIVLSVGEYRYGENITVTALLNSNATGNVVFRVLNMTKTVEINGGIAKWTFTGLNVGNYTINANYLGDRTYISSKNSTDFEISKANSTMELNVGDVYLNENILIYAILSPNATGSVSFSIKDYYSPRSKPVTNSIAVWYISPLNTGSYKVLASYDGDSNYYGCDGEYVINITQRKSVLNVEIADAGKNDRVTVKARLTSGDGEPINGTVKVTIASKSYDVYINKGSGTLVIGKMDPADYTYTAVYEGNDEFSKSSITGSFKVVGDLLNMTIIAKNQTLFYGNTKDYVIKAVDDNNNALSGISVTVMIDATSYDLITDDKGEARIQISLGLGNHTVESIFSGNARYNEFKINTRIEVLSTLEGIDVKTIYGSSAQYFAKFTDSSGKALSNAEVTFRIGNNVFTTRTHLNGICKLSLKFAPGKYVITTTNPVTGQKISNSIYIFARLMENKDVSVYYGAGGKYKVRAYDDNGNPVGSGKTVTFKINGKKYNVKTDKKGFAVYKFNLKPKNYKVSATYNGFSVSNNIFVKPVLTAKVTIKKSKIIKIKAKLLNKKGKALKGKKIKVKFKGKTYKMKTNKKGIAKLKIKYKFRVGTHKLKIKYGKSTITKTIKINK